MVGGGRMVSKVGEGILERSSAVDVVHRGRAVGSEGPVESEMAKELFVLFSMGMDRGAVESVVGFEEGVEGGGRRLSVKKSISAADEPGSSERGVFVPAGLVEEKEVRGWRAIGDRGWRGEVGEGKSV